MVAVADAVLGTALGLFVSAFAQTEFQAVQFMPLLVIPQILLCGLFVPRVALPGVLEAISDVLPLSYAVDAMKDADPARTQHRARSGTTSRSSSASRWSPWPSALPRCDGVRRNLIRAPAGPARGIGNASQGEPCLCSASRCCSSRGASG